jgi:hypothetical protein
MPQAPAKIVGWPAVVIKSAAIETGLVASDTVKKNGRTGLRRNRAIRIAGVAIIASFASLRSKGFHISVPAVVRALCRRIMLAGTVNFTSSGPASRLIAMLLGLGLPPARKRGVSRKDGSAGAKTMRSQHGRSELRIGGHRTFRLFCHDRTS